MPLHLIDNLQNLSNAATGRAALGSGAVGDDVFIADTQAAVHASIGLFPVSTQEFTSGSGTIALSTDSKYVSFTLIGGGGGGGSGRRGAAGAGRSGGTGGRGGCVVQLIPIPVTKFTWPLSYTVGSGGSGGAAVTTDNTNGNVGVNGGDTTITSNGTVFRATGGARGNGGLQNAAASGSAATLSSGILGGPLSFNTQNGSSASSATANISAPTDVNTYHAGFGGAGGGISSTNTVLGAGRGNHIGPSTVYQVLGGLAGVVGASGDEIGQNGNSDLISGIGTGGGGGIATPVTFAGNAGGNGAPYGGAGAGGSASVNGQPSGPGGNGANGLIQITFWY